MNKVLQFLGLAMKSGKIVSGEQAVQSALKNKKCSLLIVARDATENTKKRMIQSAVFSGIPYLQWGEKEALGRALGKADRSSVAVCDAGFAKKISSLCQENEIE